MGKLGYDIVVSHLNEKDLRFSQGAVSTYNSIKNVIWQGDLYRLVDPKKNDFAALMFNSKDKKRAVLFSYLVGNRNGAGSEVPFRLQGLDPAKKYKVKELNIYPDTKTSIKEDQTYSGDYLMTSGFNPVVNARRASVILEFSVVE